MSLPPGIANDDDDAVLLVCVTKSGLVVAPVVEEERALRAPRDERLLGRLVLGMVGATSR